MESNSNNNRLHLNFANERLQLPNDRAYPTTPSTFPQPVFPPPGAAGQQASTAASSQQQSYAAGGGSYAQAPQGYFAQGNYPAGQYPAGQATTTYDYNNAPNPNAAYQGRANGPAPTDPNTGLAHQFSHQNLGGAARAAPYPPRGPGSAQRPRTAGATGQQPGPYAGYNNIPLPSQVPSQASFQAIPERNPDKYGSNANSNQKKCSQLAADFFKDSVKRARERNQRYIVKKHKTVISFFLFLLTYIAYYRQSELEQKLSDPAQNAARKEQLWTTAGRKEGQYLRFLRTKDKPENYNTIKIIGKGAFGEVKLVQKKGDGKVYAMKSLIKTEMFKKDQLAHVRSERDILAESDSPWVVKLYTTFQDSYFLYMLMEFLPGGDLMTMLIKYEIFTEDITRFYIAEIVLAIEAVHKLGFIHRLVLPLPHLTNFMGKTRNF